MEITQAFLRSDRSDALLGAFLMIDDKCVRFYNNKQRPTWGRTLESLLADSYLIIEEISIEEGLNKVLEWYGKWPEITL